LRLILVSNFSLLLSSLAPVFSAHLLVASASDLAPLQSELAVSFKKHTGHSARFTTGSSGMLARQVAAGAPYDVFLSANYQYVAELSDSGHIAKQSVVVYAEGRLGLWSRSGSVVRLEQLTNKEIRHVAIANPQHAPYGVAAREALERGGLSKPVQPKIVYGENVRQAMQYAESANADAVITAWSLMIGRGVLLDASLHAPIKQAAGIVARSKEQDQAREFLDFLLSPAGAAIFRRYGFIPAER
jgi:molybdate transport system substrate-binding protein